MDCLCKLFNGKENITHFGDDTYVSHLGDDECYEYIKDMFYDNGCDTIVDDKCILSQMYSMCKAIRTQKNVAVLNISYSAALSNTMGFLYPFNTSGSQCILIVFVRCSFSI